MEKQIESNSESELLIGGSLGEKTSLDVSKLIVNGKSKITLNHVILESGNNVLITCKQGIRLEGINQREDAKIKLKSRTEISVFIHSLQTKAPSFSKRDRRRCARYK